jgi:hypothetical protein
MNDYYGYGLIDLRSHAAYEGLHRLLNLEYPRVGRCEWCWGPGRRAGYAVAEPGRYSLNRANWLELCNRCHIYYDGVHRPLAAPRSERELEALYARCMEPYRRIMESRGVDPPRARRALPARPRQLDAQQHGPGAPTRRTVEQSPYAGVVIMQAAARLVLPRWRRTRASRRALHDANDRPPGPDPAFVD